MFPPNTPILSVAIPKRKREFAAFSSKVIDVEHAQRGANVATEMSTTFITSCRPAALSPDWSDRDAARVASKQPQWAHRFPRHRRILRILAGFASVRVCPNTAREASRSMGQGSNSPLLLNVWPEERFLQPITGLGSRPRSPAKRISNLLPGNWRALKLAV
jgi:hypothetical protein